MIFWLKPFHFSLDGLKVLRKSRCHPTRTSFDSMWNEPTLKNRCETDETKSERRFPPIGTGFGLPFGALRPRSFLLRCRTSRESEAAILRLAFFRTRLPHHQKANSHGSNGIVAWMHGKNRALQVRCVLDQA